MVNRILYMVKAGFQVLQDPYTIKQVYNYFVTEEDKWANFTSPMLQLPNFLSGHQLPSPLPHSSPNLLHCQYPRDILFFYNKNTTSALRNCSSIQNITNPVHGGAAKIQCMYVHIVPVHHCTWSAVGPVIGNSFKSLWSFRYSTVYSVIFKFNLSC